MPRGAEVEQQEKEEHSGGGSEGLERRSPARPLVMGSGGASFQGCTKHMCSYISTKTLPAL